MKFHITRNFFRLGLERSSVRSGRCRAVISQQPAPRGTPRSGNQWTEHCESNSHAGNYRSGKLLIGRARNALQTQFPTSGIELRRCDQLGLRSFHLTNVPNACPTSVAGINPGSAHHCGCGRECDNCADERTECCKPETCLHAIYLKRSKIDISANLRVHGPGS